jgi:hypothetical protein
LQHLSNHYGRLFPIPWLGKTLLFKNERECDDDLLM